MTLLCYTLIAVYAVTQFTHVIAKDIKSISTQQIKKPYEDRDVFDPSTAGLIFAVGSFNDVLDSDYAYLTVQHITATYDENGGRQKIKTPLPILPCGDFIERENLSFGENKQQRYL